MILPHMGFHLIAPLALFPHSCKLLPLMATPLDPNDLVPREELAISNLWEVTMPVFDLP